MDKKISELDQAIQINNGAVFPMSQDNSGTDTTYKATITQLSTEIGEGQTFSNLQTTDKTLVGAINEVAQGGGGGGSSNANIAPDYDATSTYAVGDWCIYNGTLYQCNTAIPTAEAFDPTHWTSKKVVDAFADIEDELDDKVDTADYNAQMLPISANDTTNTKDYIDSLKTVETLTDVTITKTSGDFTIDSATVRRMGKFVSIDITFKGNGTSVGSGVNAFDGTINAHLPINSVEFAVGWFGSQLFTLLITSGGTFRVRNTSTTALSTSNNMSFSITYIEA